MFLKCVLNFVSNCSFRVFYIAYVSFVDSFATYVLFFDVYIVFGCLGSMEVCLRDFLLMLCVVIVCLLGVMVMIFL